MRQIDFIAANTASIADLEAALQLASDRVAQLAIARGRTAGTARADVIEAEYFAACNAEADALQTLFLARYLVGKGKRAA